MTEEERRGTVQVEHLRIEMFVDADVGLDKYPGLRPAQSRPAALCAGSRNEYGLNLRLVSLTNRTRVHAPQDHIYPPRKRIPVQSQ